MQNIEDLLEKFFADYEKRMNDALGDPPRFDIQATSAAFANCWVEASPVGIVCGKNDETFLEQIPKGYEFYRSIGTQSMNVTNLEVTMLDDLHAVAKVSWDSRYVKKDGVDVQIEFDIFYFVQIKDGEPKIFAYVTGDERKALREYGLIADEG